MKFFGRLTKEQTRQTRWDHLPEKWSTPVLALLNNGAAPNSNFRPSVLNIFPLQFLEDKMHPTVIIQAFRQALEDMVAILGDEVGVTVNMDDDAQLIKVVQSCIGTKFISRWADLAVKIAIDAVKKVTVVQGRYSVLS